MALSLNDLKKGKAGKTAVQVISARRMVRPWEDPTDEERKQETNPEQSQNKQATNRVQIENKQGTQQGTNRVQIGNKQGTVFGEKKGKQGTQRVTSTRVNRVQIENKQGTKWSFEKLRGHEARLLQLVFDECHQTGELISPPLTLERIAEYLGSLKDTAKTIVYRLAKKGLVKRENSAVGRGGYTRFRLEKDLYQALLIRETGNKWRTNRIQTENKQGTQQRTERVTKPPSSSSSSLDLNKLTNTGPPEASADLPAEWDEIDTSSLTAIRFGRQQLVQLVRLGTLTVDQVQESINAFSFDLEVNGKGREINGHALNYFMGILRKGPYAPPANYEPPEVRQMRLYLEAKERQQKERLELELRLENIEFDEWEASLTAEERSGLVSPSEFAKLGSQGHKVQLKEYFREHLWSERREKVLGGVNKRVSI